MTTAPELDVEKCRELLALQDGNRSGLAISNHVANGLADQLKAAFIRLAEAREALILIRLHHTEINNRAGRPLERSNTLKLANSALDRIPDLSELKL